MGKTSSILNDRECIIKPLIKGYGPFRSSVEEEWEHAIERNRGQRSVGDCR